MVNGEESQNTNVIANCIAGAFLCGLLGLMTSEPSPTAGINCRLHGLFDVLIKLVTTARYLRSPVNFMPVCIRMVQSCTSSNGQKLSLEILKFKALI